MRNLHLTFDYSTYRQKLGKDFAKFCGLLRIYELYDHKFLVDYLHTAGLDTFFNQIFMDPTLGLPGVSKEQEGQKDQ